MALGGSYASGTDSFAAAIGDNSASYGAQASNSIAIGYRAKVTSTNGVAFGYTATSTGISSLALGYGALASATGATAIGLNAAATASNSMALGNKSSANQIGKLAFSPAPLVAGQTQFGLIVLTAGTSGTVVVLTSDTNTAGSGNQLILSTDQAMVFTGTMIGKQSGSANIAAYEIKGTLVNNAGTLTMPTGTVTLIGTDSIGLTTSPTLTANNTNKGLTVTSGAKTATNIRWVATIQTSEITYI
jgi:hypothetical protein